MGMRGHKLALWTAALWIAGSFGATASEPFMATGGRTTQPVGHYEFCRTNAPSARSAYIRWN